MDPQGRTQAIAMNPFSCAVWGAPVPTRPGGLPCAAHAPRTLRRLQLTHPYLQNKTQTSTRPSVWEAPAGPASSVAAARTAPPTQHCPCKSWLLWVPAALDKPLKGPERAVSSVRQSRGRAEVSFIRCRGACYPRTCPRSHRPPCPVCACPPLGFSPASRALPLGMAKMQNLGKAGPRGAERGSALSFPHKAHPPRLSSSLSLAPRSPWSALSGRPGCLVLIPMPPTPESQTRMEKASTHRQPTLRDTWTLYFILEPEHTSFLAGLPR